VRRLGRFDHHRVELRAASSEADRDPGPRVPYLNVVRVASGAAQAYWDGPTAFKDLGTPAADQRLDSILAPLDFSLRATASQVPARLRLELDDVAHQVEVGRALIAYRQTEDLPFLESPMAGTTSLGNASDLVGRACGSPLFA
jgi:hypothetical protein